MARLQMTDAGFKTDGKTLLGPLTLTHDCAGITAVMGPNGAGKSLFLGLCHGIVEQSHGSVTWQGIAAQNTRIQRGFMAQQVALLRRSVFANVEFALQAQGIPRPDRRARVANALRKARLLDKAQTPAAALSGGEQRRMALARALVGQPKILLMDEPAAGLDPASLLELETMVRAVKDSGVTVLMVIHDIAQAKRLADHILFFSHGNLSENTPAAEFFAAPRSRAARMFLEGQLE